MRAVVLALLTSSVAAAAPGRPSVSFDLPRLTGEYDGKLVSTTLKRSSDALVACYVKAHAVNPKLVGVIIVRFTIDTEGEISVSAASGFGDAGSECVTLALSSVEFTPAPEADVEVSQTIRFVPPSVKAQPQERARSLEAQLRDCTCLTSVPSLESWSFPTPVTTVTLGVPIVSGPGQLDQAAIRRYVKRELVKLDYCYERQLLAKPKLAGGFTAELTIDESGSVKTPGVTSNALHDPDVETCVVHTLEAIRFPRPVAGTVTVRYPMTFAPNRLAATPK